MNHEYKTQIDCNGDVTEMCLPASSSTSTSTSTSEDEVRVEVGGLWVKKINPNGNPRFFIGGYIGKRRIQHRERTVDAAVAWAQNEIEKANCLGSDFSRLSSGTRIEMIAAYDRARTAGIGLLDAVLFYEANRAKKFVAADESQAAKPLAGKGIRAAMNEYRDHCEYIGHGTKKISAIKTTVERLVRDFGDNRPVDFFTEEILTQWVAGLTNTRTGEPLSPLSRNVARGTLGAWFEFCRKRNWIGSNPAHAMDSVKAATPDREIISVAAAEAIMRIVESRFPHLIGYYAICLFAGMRPSEVLRLRWSRHIRLDADEPIINMPEEVVQKTCLSRVFELRHAPNLIAWLKRAKEISKSDEVASQTDLTVQHNHRSAFEHIWHDAGFERWPQDAMRHSFVSYHIQSFGDRKLTAELSGHTIAVQKKHYENKATPSDDPKEGGEVLTQRYAAGFFNILPVNKSDENSPCVVAK